MLPVEIMHTQGTVILRARSSELLILPYHVRELKGRLEAREFSDYFTREALVNRPARKLFEAWLRKDRTLWPRLFKVIHRDIDMKDVEAAEATLAESMGVRPNAKTASETKVNADVPTTAPAVAEAEDGVAKPKKSVKAKATKVAKAKASEGEAKPAAVKKVSAKKADTSEKKATVKKASSVKKSPKGS